VAGREIGTLKGSLERWTQYIGEKSQNGPHRERKNTLEKGLKERGGEKKKPN